MIPRGFKKAAACAFVFLIHYFYLCNIEKQLSFPNENVIHIELPLGWSQNRASMDIYNRSTFLNEEYIQYINYVIILLFFVLAFYIEQNFTLFTILVLFLISIVFSIVLTDIIARKVSFIENHEKERKQWEFKYHYFVICSVLSFFLSVSVLTVFKRDFVWISWIPVVYFAFNIVFIPNLFYYFFKDCLYHYI